MTIGWTVRNGHIHVATFSERTYSLETDRDEVDILGVAQYRQSWTQTGIPKRTVANKLNVTWYARMSCLASTAERKNMMWNYSVHYSTTNIHRNMC